MSVGFKIKKLREENNLSQSKLADCLGISQSELSKIENGRAKKIDIHFVMEVCSYFNKPLDFFTLQNRSEKEEGNFNIEISSGIVLNELEKIVREYQKKR